MRELFNAGIRISLYDPKIDFNYHYIHQVFSQLWVIIIKCSHNRDLPRYELRSDDFTMSHLEGWFTSNIWSVIVDACLIDLETVEFVRSEVKLLLGRKCDGIARELGSPEEFAISEGRCWTGEDGTKYLSDALKMPKVMRDMLHQRIRRHSVSFYRIARCLEHSGGAKLKSEDLKDQLKNKRFIQAQTDDDHDFHDEEAHSVE
ncbi:hypothetical protein BC936DRAFT_138196 [Jimgerdemannia flammicorona]|uniref:Uncharacterized protein n=1 Tax=Jimgerdemannia flammicorona TaxID=994334 RepID=A0A433CW38_9FUNG|nr:hypothetical protein BC936DRAFT_138196 [Jimgerdemannia flammicorona]